MISIDGQILNKLGELIDFCNHSKILDFIRSLGFYSHKKYFKSKRRILEGKEKKKRRIKVGRKISSISKSFMSVQKLTFKYEEYKMTVEGAHNDMMVAVNENEEIEIIEC